MEDNNFTVNQDFTIILVLILYHFHDISQKKMKKKLILLLLLIIIIILLRTWILEYLPFSIKTKKLHVSEQEGNIQNDYLQNRQSVSTNMKIKEKNEEPSYCQGISYETLLKPCLKRLSSGISFEQKNTNNYETTKANLSQVVVNVAARKSNKLPYIFIKTFNSMNERKTRGGDSWIGYLENKNENTSMAFHLTDLTDGTYIAYLDDEILTAGNYTLQLVLEHSHCDGLADPPGYWFAKGK